MHVLWFWICSVEWRENDAGCAARHRLLRALASTSEAVIVADHLAEGTIRLGGLSIEGGHQPLLRIEADGSVPWVNANPYSPESQYAVIDLNVSEDGRIAVSATTPSPVVDLGGGPHNAALSYDHVAASYEADGTYRWSMRLGGPLKEGAFHFSRDASGQSVLIGEMVEQIDFGDGQLIGEGRDLFLLRFAAD